MAVVTEETQCSNPKCRGPIIGHPIIAEGNKTYCSSICFIAHHAAEEEAENEQLSFNFDLKGGDPISR